MGGFLRRAPDPGLWVLSWGPSSRRRTPHSSQILPKRATPTARSGACAAAAPTPCRTPTPPATPRRARQPRRGSDGWRRRASAARPHRSSSAGACGERSERVAAGHVTTAHPPYRRDQEKAECQLRAKILQHLPNRDPRSYNSVYLLPVEAATPSALSQRRGPFDQKSIRYSAGRSVGTETGPSSSYSITRSSPSTRTGYVFTWTSGFVRHRPVWISNGH